MKKITSIILWSLIMIIGILQITNNALDRKYLIEPFEKDDNIYELKRIANEKLLNNTDATILIIFLFIGYTILIFSPKSKK